MHKKIVKNIHFVLAGFVICFGCLVIAQIVSVFMLYQNSLKFEKNYLKDTVCNEINSIEIARNEIKREWDESGKDYTETDVKVEITRILKKKLHETTYSNEGYIWINEVKNYEGGNDYGIRLIHPNLPETEGERLSTYTKDANGNTPYKTQLEGVKNNNEIYYSFYFKKLNSNKVGKKITYAKLYKRYDWIICMGVYYDAVKGTTFLAKDWVQWILGLGYIASFGGIIMLIIFTRMKVKTEMLARDEEMQGLHKKIDVDTLTKACSRHCGEEILKKEFYSYKLGGNSPAIAIFDIDHFKQINDKYGHNFGDKILITVVSALKGCLREKDHIIRWGGDEFILVLPGLPKKSLATVMEKCNKIVRISEAINENNIATSVTISIGAGYFEKSDLSVESMIKRIDNALYDAKKERNTYRIANTDSNLT